MSDWCILRCSGRHTLPLADSLNSGGYECWTPARHVRKRIPRTRARIELPAPLLPTYVFARAGELHRLLDIVEDQHRGQQVVLVGDDGQHLLPDFSVFHYLDRIPLVADTELVALRLAERRAEAPAKAKRRFVHGEPVSVSDGPWVGLSGMVQDQKGNYTIVLFGRMSVKIATFLLHPGERVAA